MIDVDADVNELVAKGVLKPCPFCGSKDLIIELFCWGKLCAIECYSCCAQGPHKDTPDEAIEIWNRLESWNGRVKE